MSTLLELLNEAAVTPEALLEQTFEYRCSVRGRAGQVIYDAGDPSDTVYILASGFARAYVGDGLSSRTTMLIKAPAVIGDRDILSGHTAMPDTVRLLTNACLFAFSREDFTAQWHASPQLRKLLADDLAQRYVTMLRWIELDASDVSDRVAQLLPALGDVKPSVASLGTMLGLSRRSVFRALAALRSRTPSADESETVALVHTLSSAPAPRRRAGEVADVHADAAA